MPREVVLDFKLYTNALKVRESDNGDLYVSGTTSSTIRDRQGDEITLDAIKSMADTAKQNMTVFLNHNYNVPEDLFGSVTDARIVKRLDADTGLEVYDLDIDVKVCPEEENPAAMQAYKAIKRGVKLGMSIGARVENVSKRKDSSGLDTYVIEKVEATLYVNCCGNFPKGVETLFAESTLILLFLAIPSLSANALPIITDPFS